MMHPLLALAVFLIILARTWSALATGRTRVHWWVINREDHPIWFWFSVTTGAMVVAILPLFHFEAWVEWALDWRVIASTLETLRTART